MPFIVYQRAAEEGESQEDVPRRNIASDVIRYTAKIHPGLPDTATGVIRKDGEDSSQIVKTDAANGEGVVVHEASDTKSLQSSPVDRPLYLYTDVELNTLDGSSPQTVIAEVLIMEGEITQRTEQL